MDTLSGDELREVNGARLARVPWALERPLALIPGSRAGAFKEAQPALGGQGEAGAIVHLVLLLSSFLPRLLSTLGTVACTQIYAAGPGPPGRPCSPSLGQPELGA